MSAKLKAFPIPSYKSFTISRHQALSFQKFKLTGQTVVKDHNKRCSTTQEVLMPKNTSATALINSIMPRRDTEPNKILQNVFKHSEKSKQYDEHNNKSKKNVHTCTHMSVYKDIVHLYACNYRYVSLYIQFHIFISLTSLQ